MTTQVLDVRGITTMDPEDAIAIYRAYKSMPYFQLHRTKVQVMRKLGSNERGLTDSRARCDSIREAFHCANIEITLDLIALVDAALVYQEEQASCSRMN